MQQHQGVQNNIFDSSKGVAPGSSWTVYFFYYVQTMQTDKQRKCGASVAILQLPLQRQNVKILHLV